MNHNILEIKKFVLFFFCCIHGQGFARTPRIVSVSDKLIIAQLIAKLSILGRNQCCPCYEKVHTFKPCFLTTGISPVLPSTARSIRWFLIRIYFSNKNFHMYFLNFSYVLYGLCISFSQSLITRIICGTKYVFLSY